MPKGHQVNKAVVACLVTSNSTNRDQRGRGTWDSIILCFWWPCARRGYREMRHTYVPREPNEQKRPAGTRTENEGRRRGAHARAEERSRTQPAARTRKGEEGINSHSAGKGGLARECYADERELMSIPGNQRRSSTRRRAVVVGQTRWPSGDPPGTL